MKKLNYKNILLYLLGLLYLLLVNILFINQLITKYSNIINPISWFLFFIISIFIMKDERLRIRSKTDKAKTVFIIILMYIVLYFISGLILGYARSPYSHNIISVIKNIWAFVIIIIFQEYVRYALVATSNKSKIQYIFIALLFTLFELNFYKFGNNFISGEEGFKYVSQYVIPALARNILFVYLMKNAGYKATLSFRLPLALINIISPIFPDLDWFLISLFELSLSFICYVVINYMLLKELREDKKKKYKKQNPIKNIPLIVILFVFVLFVAGLFKYMPIAIMSNSMADVIYRGDVVIIKKLTSEEKEKLQVGDIVQYQRDGALIVHRINKITRLESGELKFITKGDNNNDVDDKPVYENNLNAKAIFKIPYIGYPVVYVNEFFTKTRPNVEMGNK